MDREDLMACFEDTVEKSNNSGLRQRTARSIKSNRVYKENFVSDAVHRHENASIDVYAGTTFDIAGKYRMLGKIAVLNFANPVRPGGGVQSGAMAQEECLCRSSNLFECLSDQKVFNEYYAYHRNGYSYFYSDRLIYTKNVVVFKDDSSVPQMLPEEKWFEVDVITCAAPYLGARKHTNGVALLDLFKSRIKNIFEAARDNGVDYLILGAFGCGAFKNPPRIVAEAFRQTIMEQSYLRDFKQIVFAIKSTGGVCPNLSAFSSVFGSYASEAGCILLPEPFEWRLRRTPKLPTEMRFDNEEFSLWQLNNRYFGKQFSVMGDSISTLEGYNPKGYKVFYADDVCEKAGITVPQDTWWDKVISFFGGELLVNNSWSGSRVTKLEDSFELFPSGCSDERTSSLHINAVKPDVILIYLGTNDWACGVQSGLSTKFLCEENEIFDEAYHNMLIKLKANYPESEIWCCTLCETYMSTKPKFKFPERFAGCHIEEYNEVIRDAAKHYGCKLIDLYQYRTAYDSIDGSHPNSSGMNTIATLMIRSMIDSEAERFLDCDDGQHEFKIIEEYTGGTEYACSRCGKIIHEMTLPPTKSDTSQTRRKAMNRKINWISGELDEIELVYEKAEQDEGIASLLEKLEAQALAEAKSNVGMLKTDDGGFLTPEQFDHISEEDKEIVIMALGNAGLASLDTDIEAATIHVELSPLITKVQACTVFNLLNRLEKLDGAINILHPEWILALRVPLGGRKGLFQWEMLIMQLYPWLSVREESTNEIAVSADAAPLSPPATISETDLLDTDMNRGKTEPVPSEDIPVAKKDNSYDASEYVMLDPNRTIILYSDILKLTVKSSGKTVQIKKNVVEVGSGISSDLLLDGKNIEQRHATFFHERDSWFLRDNFSSNGTWINGVRIQPGKKYQLAADDEINFAADEYVTFYELTYTKRSAGDPDAKAVAILEASMTVFAKSRYTDDTAYKLILSALSNAPLYIPVVPDKGTMAGQSKPGDAIRCDQQNGLRFMTLRGENGQNIVPMFTSTDEVNKGPATPEVVELYPKNYLTELRNIEKYAIIINPFSENRFLLSKNMIEEELLPLVRYNEEPRVDVPERPEDKYVGKVINGKYDVIEKIESSLYYTVYRVRDLRFNKLWAMKVCEKNSRNYNPVIRDAMISELQMTRKLDHSAIPKPIDLLEDDEVIIVVREYVEGDSLDTIAKIYGAQSVDKVVEWGKQLCEALGYLHSQNPPLIYRDMKPANVILGPFGVLSIIDFGTMRTYKPGKKVDTCCIGTRGYAAPEQFGGNQTDARTDIFGLGMTMFRLVTGIDPIKPPYEIKPICSIDPSLPKGLEYIITKCTRPNPDERYQSCDELLNDLNNYMKLPRPKGMLGRLLKK